MKDLRSAYLFVAGNVALSSCRPAERQKSPAPTISPNWRTTSRTWPALSGELSNVLGRRSKVPRILT